MARWQGLPIFRPITLTAHTREELFKRQQTHQIGLSVSICPLTTANLERMVFVIGITGGIASGKSSLSKLLLQKLQGSLPEKSEVSLIDADKLGHLAYISGSTAYHKLVDRFGAENILTEPGESEDSAHHEERAIDRRKLGAIVFSDKAEMDALCDIVWPVIRSSIETSLQELGGRDKEQYVILEAAVMLEAKWEDMISGMLIVTYVDRDVAKSRLMERNSLSEEEALKRIDAQMGNSERLTRVCGGEGGSDDTCEVSFEENNLTFYDGNHKARTTTTFENRGSEDEMKEATNTIAMKILGTG